MGALQVIGDREGLAADLAGGEPAAEIAALLGRWTEPGRPAVLVVLDGIRRSPSSIPRAS